MQPPLGCYRGVDLEHNHTLYCNIREMQDQLQHETEVQYRFGMKDLMDTVETNNDVDDLLPSCSNIGTTKSP